MDEITVTRLPREGNPDIATNVCSTPLQAMIDPTSTIYEYIINRGFASYVEIVDYQ